MATAIYNNGEYLAQHPSWHVEDALWKAAKVKQIMARNHLNVRTIVEIGCGAGKTLADLQASMPAYCTFEGYEISPQAFALCSGRENGRLRFKLGSGPALEDTKADLVLSLDVVEHVENYLEFLRTAKNRGQYCIFHIPLDLSLLGLLTGLPRRVRRSAGHLHYFTRGLALDALAESGYRVVDAAYTRPAMERPCERLRGRIAKWPRLLLAWISEDLAALLLGGFSLLVLAEGANEA